MRQFTSQNPPRSRNVTVTFALPEGGQVSLESTLGDQASIDELVSILEHQYGKPVGHVISIVTGMVAE